MSTKVSGLASSTSRQLQELAVILQKAIDNRHDDKVGEVLGHRPDETGNTPGDEIKDESRIRFLPSLSVMAPLTRAENTWTNIPRLAINPTWLVVTPRAIMYSEA